MFIGGRNVLDCFVRPHVLEVHHWRKQGVVLCRLNFEKAYDRLNWISFLKPWKQEDSYRDGGRGSLLV